MSSLASKAAKARWARNNTDPGSRAYLEAQADHQHARLSRAIADASTALPNMPRERIEALIVQLAAWDGTDRAESGDDSSPTTVSLRFGPRHPEIGRVVKQTPQSVTVYFPGRDETHKFRLRGDGKFRRVEYGNDSPALEFVDDPDGLL